MANLAPPTKTLGVTLLHKCNFNCPHSGYLYVDESEDHGLKPGYRMTWDQIQRVIADCNSIRDETFSFVINGGEPTLWEEGELKFIDVLLAVSAGNIHPTYNTNGSYFVDYAQCHEFLYRYSEKADIPLLTFISIDKFHDNYDRKKGRAESLDSIVKVLSAMPADKKEKHRFHVVSIVSKDPNSFLPAEMKEYYSAKETITEGLIDYVEKRIPGVSRLIAYKELGTPLSNEHFTLHANGSIYGLAATPYRYRQKWLHPETPVKNLFLTGSDICSLGVVCAMMSGVATASRMNGSLGLFKLIKKLRQHNRH